MKLVWTKRARADLEAIRRFSISRWGQPTAYRYLAALRDVAKRSAANPDQCRLLSDRYRLVRSQSHFIVFSVDVASGVVVVARVLHAAMDLERHLPPENV